ncbi:Predicted dithiol-disulfide isomerase, DsbA family [Pseudonocardia ammonioxydans]|uniref:Predicted dithiol-disulfide isomerase, DsbA family n=1 Tax=Pseudonocardia ammonioxydans TaxID=260086 RepID=A0A1I5H5L1_PSUAM|nr:DsbA family protein [Pseudonocardia ammonioxydans]SFO43554.1 Predicted dithiol-disulfide isomerase, DsbA family [Pseudonocardia ammonioxydans]
MTRPDPVEHTVIVYTDVMCGWSTLALHRLYRARQRAGMEERLAVELRLFLLEDINTTPLTSDVIEPEKPVIGPLEPDLGIVPWHGRPSAYPVTSAPANEAVHAARIQSAAAAEELDMALRLAFWRDSRCISLRHEILDVAGACEQVDADHVREAVDDGRARGPMIDDYLTHRDAVSGSPHLFLPDGSDHHNPGIRFHQFGQPGAGYPVLDGDDPAVYDEIVRTVMTG